LKAHNPDLITVGNTRPEPFSKCQRNEVVHSKPVHIFDTPDKSRGRIRVHSEPSMEKDTSLSPVLEQKKIKDTNENLFQMLGILEEEFRELKDQYHSLVKQYEVVAESMTNDSITRDSGSATLKAIGDDLTHCIQSMETKVSYFNPDRANENFERYHVIVCFTGP
jgi:hypothetical protein